MKSLLLGVDLWPCRAFGQEYRGKVLCRQRCGVVLRDLHGRSMAACLHRGDRLKIGTLGLNFSEGLCAMSPPDHPAWLS